MSFVLFIFNALEVDKRCEFVLSTLGLIDLFSYSLELRNFFVTLFQSIILSKIKLISKNFSKLFLRNWLYLLKKPLIYEFSVLVILVTLPISGGPFMET